MKKWLYLVAAIVLEVSGSLSLKAAMDAPPFYVIVVLGYLGAFVGLFAALRHGMSLGVGYGIWGATGVAATAVLSLVIFHEPITPVMGVGIVMVIGGVLLVELGSQIALRQQTGLATQDNR